MNSLLFLSRLALPATKTSTRTLSFFSLPTTQTFTRRVIETSSRSTTFTRCSRATSTRWLSSAQAQAKEHDHDDDDDDDDEEEEDFWAEPDAPVFVAEEKLQIQYHEQILDLLEYERFDDAVALYRNMQMERVKVLSETRLELIAYSPAISDCLQFLKDMNRSGDRPSVAVYNDVITRCAECQLEFTARRLLNEMEAYGVEPNMDTYASVIRAIGRARWTNHQVAYDFAMEICDKLDMKMPERLLLEVVKSCRQKTSLPLVKRIMSEAFERGVTPTSALFNASMGCCSRYGDMDYALELFDKMEALGVAKTTSTYCLLVEIIHDRHRHDVELNKRAVELFRTMLFTEVPPTLTACHAVEAMAQSLDDDETVAMAREAAEIVEALIDSNYN